MLVHTISCCARFFSAFPSPSLFFRTSNLAKALRHATRRASFRSAICQCSAAVPRSLQVACTATRALEAFPSGQVRRKVIRDETGLENMGGEGGGAQEGEAVEGMEQWKSKKAFRWYVEDYAQRETLR
jgi:hypothetical protein